MKPVYTLEILLNKSLKCLEVKKTTKSQALTVLFITLSQCDNYVWDTTGIIIIDIFSSSLLQTEDVDERLAAVKLLGQMFTEQGSELATQNKQLWNSYLGR